MTSGLRGVSEALVLLRRAVGEKGEDYVYPQSERAGGTINGTCQYATRDGSPSCIVGHVASYIGSLEEVHSGYEGDGAEVALADDFDGPALHVLSAAQGTQDNGLTWGEALQAATEKARR